MEKETYNGNVLQNPKYKKQQDVSIHHQIAMENAGIAEPMAKFHGKQGHGFAAERANNLLDRIHGLEASVTGDGNAPNGDDRMVEGCLIQTKYCQTAAESVNAAFRNGTYRYIDSKGNFMQLEVPKDQYNEAVQHMRRKIEKGQVPGTNNPDDATKIVRQGNVDYATAKRIAKAGNIDSLTFDAAHGAIIATTAMGISATITFAQAVWRGEDVSKALEISICSGIKAGGIAFASSVLTAQLARMGLNKMLMAPSVELVKIMPSSIRHRMVNTLRDAANINSKIYGQAATNNLAKSLRANIAAAAITVVVMSAGDISDYFQNKISGKQLFKNVSTVASGVVGGYLGAAAGFALGGPLGAFAMGLIGGTLSTEATKKLMDEFIEDDAVEMVSILNQQIILLAQEYLLSEEELKIVVDELQDVLKSGALLYMYASEDRVAFANELLTKAIEDVIKWRVNIVLPNNEEMMKSIGVVFDKAQKVNGLSEYAITVELDSKKIGEKLLGRDLPERAARKAWYVTRQMNVISQRQEFFLHKIVTDEKEYRERTLVLQQEIDAYKEEVRLLLEGTEDGK